MVRTCPHCGSCEIDEDAARGDATCTECGTVLEESIVVSENQFQERAGGSGHTLVGQFVSMERQSHSLQGVPGLVSHESREITFSKGKRAHVVASCMYMTCRLENTPHLLLDFSDVTQVNVFDLGRCLSFLSRSLRINLPSTDPCLYIMRFACLLEFGDKQKEVVNLATRLVERMKRDWISTGRRPTGLCGAALLIAARAYNFNRSISDVVRVVHISETVVRKRLEEFSQTPSGALSIDDFQSIDLEQSEDPPAFLAARKKAREDKLKEEQCLAEGMTDEVQKMEVEVEKALEVKRREKFKHSQYAKELTGVDQLESIGKPAVAFVNEQILQSVYEAAEGVEGPSGNFSQYGPTLQSLGIRKQVYLDQDDTPPLPAADNDNGDLNLEDIDDDEIDSYILSNAESEIKERFWMKVNGEHLKEMERRKKEREEADAKEPDIKKKKKKLTPNGARPALQDNGPMPSTAAEAIEKVIQEKKLSNKVNYDILKEIDHAIPGMTEQQILKPPPIFEPSNLIKRERTMARKNCHGASLKRLNMVKEALNPITVKSEPNAEKNQEEEEDKKEYDIDEKPVIIGRRFQKPRPNLTAAKKNPVIANAASKSSASSKEPVSSKESSIFKTLMVEPEVVDEQPTTSSEPKSKKMHVEPEVEPASLRLLRGKRVTPVLKKIAEKKEAPNGEAISETSLKTVLDAEQCEIAKLKVQESQPLQRRKIKPVPRTKK